MNVFIVMFLLLICANVASLVFARAVTRHTEIAVRTALGASRGRIVMQLFAESLVLAGVAAAVGLWAARSILEWWLSVMTIDAGGRLPFWLTPRISVTTLLYSMGLTIITAAIAGVLPALKVTGRRIEGQLRQASAGNIHARFGGVWTAIIVAQVAVTVAFPATAFFAGSMSRRPVHRRRFRIRAVPSRPRCAPTAHPGRATANSNGDCWRSLMSPV